MSERGGGRERGREGGGGETGRQTQVDTDR